MQFVTNGPDIPDELLQAHEEGKVVFFCGAGISYAAGLPGFQGLVDSIYGLCGTNISLEANELLAYTKKQYDVTLDLLERRLPGQRLTLRKQLLTALQPNYELEGALDTHSALLNLAKNRDGTLRLITTNFDHLFKNAASKEGISINEFSAPMLPIPKQSRWDGIVYLHGLLPDIEDKAALNRLVITSGDFGLAYLTERWASRFVTELFRNYVVCFVGYTINDPILRYMMDALAADRILGETSPTAWAFAECKPNQESTAKSEWLAKGVQPILYNIEDNHSALHKSIQSWGNVYRDGIQGKESIVSKYAIANPQESTIQDNFTKKVLWALSDKSGLPAKRFANINPAPSLDWLFDVFLKENFNEKDLPRFGVSTNINNDISFSLIRRPIPLENSPRVFWSSLTGHFYFRQFIVNR